jgi:hypothetical protein
MRRVRPVVRRCGGAVNSELPANPQSLKVAHVLATLRPSGAASTTSRIGGPARR